MHIYEMKIDMGGGIVKRKIMIAESKMQAEKHTMAQVYGALAALAVKEHE